MAYATSNSPGLIAQKNGSDGRAVWYYSSADTFPTVAGLDYFTNGEDLGMKVGDTIIVNDTTNSTTNISNVVAIDSDGNASIAGQTQELTASGAVNPGARIVELNHATVVVAATIADFGAHSGIFIVKDTSASGTAAHTLTLTGGTFDGTNTVATLNAPAEQLVVFVDGAGNGTIVQNTGSVALS